MQVTEIKGVFATLPFSGYLGTPLALANIRNETKPNLMKGI